MASFDEAVPPGQEGYLNVTVRTADLHGLVRRTIAVSTNDPERPERTLQVSVNAVGSVRVLPRNRIILADLRRASTEQVLVVRKDPTETGQLTISDVRADADWLDVRAAPAASGDIDPPPGVAVEPGDWLLRVGVADSPGPGHHRGSVRFSTGLGREPEVSIPVTLTLRPVLILAQQEVEIERPGPGETTEARVTATLRRGLDPGTVRISAVPKAFEVVTERTGPRTIEVLVRLPHGARLPSRGVLRFEHAEETSTIPIVVATATAAAR